MTGFSHKVPNGKYLAKLYFAETYNGIADAGQRVFTFNVEGKEFKDFDIWKKAGGPRKAYVESVSVEVADGELSIAFAQQAQSPAIKAIEIIPQGDDAKEADTIRVKAGESMRSKIPRGMFGWQMKVSLAEQQARDSSISEADVPVDQVAEVVSADAVVLDRERHTLR